MVSIQKEIEHATVIGKKVCIIFPADFALLGSEEAVRQGLSRLVKEHKLIRLTQGVYLYPEIDAEIGVIYPPIESIAEAIAQTKENTSKKLNANSWSMTHILS